MGFDRNNKLMAFDGVKNMWDSKWEKSVTYKKNDWYTVEVEKTKKEYILRIFDKENNLLKEARVDIADVWHGDSRYPEYFVIGDPHENYYQGSFKIKSISISSPDSKKHPTLMLHNKQCLKCNIRKGKLKG